MTYWIAFWLLVASIVVAVKLNDPNYFFAGLFFYGGVLLGRAGWYIERWIIKSALERRRKTYGDEV